MIDTTEPVYDPLGDSRTTLSANDLRDAARQSVREGSDIRSRVHDVTLLALRGRRFDRYGMREAMSAVTEGVALGAGESRADLRASLADAFRGMDDALTQSAQAGSAALKQLVATGRDLSDNELKQALATMKRLENDFIDTVSRTASVTGERIQPELRRVLDAARVSGTDSGRMAATTMTELAQRFGAASIDVALASLDLATEVGARMAQVAGGVLSGIADALAPPGSDTHRT
jgi:hypothetical protein